MKAKKLLITAVLLGVMAFCGITVNAAEIVDSGSCGADGNNVTWTYDSDGVLTISGSGAMEDFRWYEYDEAAGGYVQYEDIPWLSVISDVKSCVIESGVTHIGNFSFINCGLSSITIPNTVTSIGDRAFANCHNLTSITITEGVTSIGTCAFYGSFKLQNITLPSTLRDIGEGAFTMCAFESITIPEGVTTIKAQTFAECTSLKSMTLPMSLTKIEDTFYNCNNLNEIHYPGTESDWEKIEQASSNYVLQRAAIYFGAEGPQSGSSGDGVTWTLDGSTLTVSGSGAMTASVDQESRKLIETIIIENGVTSIGTEAFAGCTRLKSVTIPESVTAIGDGAFAACSNLTDITIPSSVITIGERAFSYCSGLTSVTIPNGVTQIADSAFISCSNLTSISLPKSITSIGEYAFKDCVELENITIPAAVTSIGSKAFEGCESLRSIEIPKGVTKIEEYTFGGCKLLRSVVIPEGVTSIGVGAFCNLECMESIVLPKSVTEIGYAAFVFYFSIPEIYYTGTQSEFESIKIGGENDLKRATIHYEYEYTAEPATSIILTIGQREMTINGEIIMNDVAPKIVNGRTMLPIRVIAEQLGAKVEWFADTRTVKITAEGIEISLVIGDSNAMANGETVKLDSPSFIDGGRTYLPLRFVSERLGADVEWDGSTQTVTITK